jgi:hypothetical protein
MEVNREMVRVYEKPAVYSARKPMQGKKHPADPFGHLL